MLGRSWSRGQRWQESKHQSIRLISTIVLPLLIGLSLLVAFAIDRFLLPPSYVASSLYAIPILLTTRRFCPRMVAGVGLLAVLLNLLNVFLDHIPLAGWLFGLIALLLISYLAVLLAIQRQEVAQLAREAEEARHQLQQFLGLVSHDLAQPLTTIQGYAQLLSRQTEVLQPKHQQRAQTAIEAAVRQMQRLIGDLKAAAQIGSGHFTLQPAPMDLVGLLRAVVSEQQATTSCHHLLLEALEPVEGRWDQDRLHQLFTNLLSNAIKYSPKGGEVCVRVQQTPQDALVSVSDHGIGMTPEQRAVLFQPFVRLNQAEAISGSGLGLYISKAIVEAHGGRIWVESEAGQGTTFYVALALTHG
jgi:signal transduction histidine kinase